VGVFFPWRAPVAMPDFLVIGAPKAGTTALNAALARHPGLYMSAIKEPKFFLSDGPPPTKGGPGDALTYREHVWRRPDYEALFDPAPAGTLRGESPPLSLYDRAAMRRIRDTLPGARLIVIVRDPVERAHSNWTHLWSAGNAASPPRKCRRYSLVCSYVPVPADPHARPAGSAAGPLRPRPVHLEPGRRAALPLAPGPGERARLPGAGPAAHPGP